MTDEYLNAILQFKKDHEDFAIVTVISRHEPSSGKVGDKALVNPYGKLSGWIGGGCVKSIVCKEAVDAIQSGHARRVIIGQKENLSSSADLKIYKMTCQSEGTVEVFIDPQVQAPHLIIMGKTMIARAVARLAKVSGYRVTVMGQDADVDSFGDIDSYISTFDFSTIPPNPGPYILIATQGESDEQALEQALRHPSSYIGFIASRKKKEAVWKYLLEHGVAQKTLDIIYSPAGIDIHAKKPEEVAISILAQIIQVKSGQSHRPTLEKEKVLSQYYINPVCGVPVDKNNPKHVIEYRGEKVYFCCDGCKVSFEKEPGKYIAELAK